jgi:hypothetical protein
MALLTAQQILDAQDLRTEDVKIEEWGGSVRIREISAADAEAAKEAAGEDGKRLFLEMIARCVVDEQGQPSFTREQADGLLKKSNRPLMKLGKAVMHINGMTEEAQKELSKNSEAPADGDGCSD